MEAQKAAKVLLVEDDPTMRSLLKTLLEIEGFRVSVLPDYSTEGEFVASFLKEKPDIIVMDVHVGKVNGINVLKQLREQPDLKSVRVYMASGMDMEDHCIDAGANGFLMKPYMPDDLITMIRSAK